MTATVTAQTQYVPQSTNSVLQPQSGQTQRGNNSQPQTSTPQSSSGSILNQPSNQSLGVVSDPTQTIPEAVAAPNPELKAENTPFTENSEGGSGILLLSGFAAIILFALFIAWRYGKQETDKEATQLLSAESLPKPERIKKSKKRHKKRKKPHQR